MKTGGKSLFALTGYSFSLVVWEYRAEDVAPEEGDTVRTSPVMYKTPTDIPRYNTLVLLIVH
jgi:hypothetical protein